MYFRKPGSGDSFHKCSKDHKVSEGQASFNFKRKECVPVVKNYDEQCKGKFEVYSFLQALPP